MALAAFADVESKPEDRVHPQTQHDVEGFLSELTQLSRKFGLAINGNPELYVMEVEDRTFAYECDEQSRLSFV